MPSARKRKFRQIATLASFLALVILGYSLRRQIAHTIANISNISIYALLLIVAWQSFWYHSYTKLYQSFFAILGRKIDYKPMLRTTLELNFVNTVFPSGGVSGFSYFGLRMRSLGVSPGQATLVHMMRFIFVFISFQFLLFSGLLMLTLGGQASRLTVLVAGSLATLLVILTAGMAFIIGSKQRIDGFFTFLANIINRIIHVFRPTHPETLNIYKVRQLFTDLHENYMLLKTDLKALKRPLMFALGANCAEILTIYTIYFAYGQFVNPGAVIIAYAVANFAGLISALPGGIGVYEGLMTAVMATAGVSPAVSLPVTVSYRIINALLQLPVGYFFYYRALHPKDSKS